ncbi:hypothetical protein LCGC14_3065890 [marine sediment metagenome]|uniref:Uncharacterized protein n=1 Tax=marine sediment metagenome TaxID=412755 RepID=A0A0F8WHF2_9ZZZZ
MIAVFLHTVIEKLKDHIDNCDGDELARLAGESFGGECFTQDGTTYIFEPNENYTGDLGENK